MKVSQLIKLLEKCDQNATVIKPTSNFEMNGANIKASGINKSNTGKKSMESFRDAFDGGSYTTETWSSFGGEESVIEIR